MRIGECALHDEEQVRAALALGQGAEVDFGWPATLSQRVLDMSRLNADEPALTDSIVSILDAELASRVAGAYDALVAAGCNKGDRIASLCDPSID
jgi:hypothetical protein